MRKRLAATSPAPPYHYLRFAGSRGSRVHEVRGFTRFAGFAGCAGFTRFAGVHKVRGFTELKLGHPANSENLENPENPENLYVSNSSSASATVRTPTSSKLPIAARSDGSILAVGKIHRWNPICAA